jgi:hypothetical protein
MTDSASGVPSSEAATGAASNPATITVTGLLQTGASGSVPFRVTLQ